MVTLRQILQLKINMVFKKSLIFLVTATSMIVTEKFALSGHPIFLFFLMRSVAVCLQS